jgi:thioredoxin-related protein
MPSLDRLQINENLGNLKIFAINISQESKKKVDSFFKDLNIKNFDPYFDAPTTLAKTFSLRGVPTSILIDKSGKEFARIIGSIDFDDKNFIEWLKTFN